MIPGAKLGAVRIGAVRGGGNVLGTGSVATVRKNEFCRQMCERDTDRGLRFVWEQRWGEKSPVGGRWNLQRSCKEPWEEQESKSIRLR